MESWKNSTKQGEMPNISIQANYIFSIKKTALSNADRLSKNIAGGIGGPKSSNFRSQISDMCGDLRGNFAKIPSLPEQAPAKMA
jgi:hypothetical protein